MTGIQSVKGSRSPIERMIDTACGYIPPEKNPGRYAFIMFDPKGLIHMEGLPGLTVCMEYAFTDFQGMGVIRASDSMPKKGSPVCADCFDGWELA